MKKLLTFLLLLSLLPLFFGCRSIREVPVERVHTEYITKNTTTIDTFIERDSVFVKEKDDTVWLERWKTIYKTSFRDRIDTVQINDTIPQIIEVEKKLSPIESFKLGSWWFLLIGAGVGVVLLVLKVKQIININN